MKVTPSSSFAFLIAASSCSVSLSFKVAERSRQARSNLALESSDSLFHFACDTDISVTGMEWRASTEYFALVCMPKATLSPTLARSLASSTPVSSALIASAGVRLTSEAPARVRRSEGRPPGARILTPSKSPIVLIGTVEGICSWGQ